MCIFLSFQYLVTDDKLLSVKSQVNEITPKNSVWLNNLIIPQKVDVKHRGLFQGKLNNNNKLIKGNGAIKL